MAQSGDFVWGYSIADATPVGMATASGGGVVWGGIGLGVADSTGFYSDFMAAGRLDSSGNSLWEDPSTHSGEEDCYGVSAGGGGALLGGVNGTAAGLTVNGTLVPASDSFVESRSDSGAFGWVAPVGVMGLSGVAAASSGGAFATGQDLVAGDRCGGPCTQGAILTAVDATGAMSWSLTYANASNLTSPVSWPDGGVSAVLSYPNGATGPGLSLTGNGTTIVKWTASSSVAWSLTAPSGATFGALAVQPTTGQLVAAVHATSAVSIGPLDLDGVTQTDGLVFLDSQGNPAEGLPWEAPIGAIAADGSGNVVIAGWDGCATAASCAGLYVAYFHAGSMKWKTSFSTYKSGNGVFYGSIQSVAIGGDGQLYVAIDGGASLPLGASGYLPPSLGATGGAYGMIAAMMP